MTSATVAMVTISNPSGCWRHWRSVSYHIELIIILLPSSWWLWPSRRNSANGIWHHYANVILDILPGNRCYALQEVQFT